MKNTMLRKSFKILEKNCRLLIHSTSGHLPGFDFQVNALLLLQVLDHRKQVARLGITFWPKHTHETLARSAEDLREFLVRDRRIDIVAQHRLTGIDITGEQAFAPFLQQALRNAGSLWARACMVSLKSFVKAIMSPLAVSGADSRANALSQQQYLHPGASWCHPPAISPTGPRPYQNRSNIRDRNQSGTHT
jgi:hypothetical protein